MTKSVLILLFKAKLPFWLCFRGVSSTVRRCIEKETGIEFAAKIIDLSNDPESREATMEEINVLRMVIGHEYISK